MTVLVTTDESGLEMDAEYRQAVSKAAQRVTAYLFDLPEALPLEVQGDILALTRFGRAKCMACQTRPVPEIGGRCASCSPEADKGCNLRSCNHRKYSTAAFPHCWEMACENYSEKCMIHKIGGSKNVD